MKSKLKTPWGFDGIIVSTKSYAAKVLVVNEGQTTPYGYNSKQDKTIYIFQGAITLNVEGQVRSMTEGDRYHIRPNVRHSLSSPTGEAIILEVGTQLEDDFVEE